MFEVFSQRDIQEVIDSNKLIVSYDNEPHRVIMDVLNDIFKLVNSFNDVEHRRGRIVKKATHILAEISHNQPFMEGNHRTLFYALKSFLGRNGFTLRFYSIGEKKNLQICSDVVKIIENRSFFCLFTLL